MDHKEIEFGNQQTRMAPTKNISSILSSLTSVLVEGGVDEETIRRLTPDLATWVESFASRLDVVEANLADRTQRCDELPFKNYYYLAFLAHVQHTGCSSLGG